MNNIIARVSSNITTKFSTKFSEERGDVPGWVLITLMTAGLVVAIWAIAAPALGTVFDQAISRVVSF